MNNNIATFSILISDTDSLDLIGLDASELSSGQMIPLGDDTAMILQETETHRGLTATEMILSGVISTVSGVSIAVLSQWLIQKLKPAKDGIKLKINDHIILTLDGNEIELALGNKDD